MLNENLKFGKYLIYGLIDPRTNELRYIGMSSSGLIRPKKHLMESSYNHPNKKHYHVYNWIRQLKQEDKSPRIEILEVSSKEHLYENEQFFISYFKSLGCRLVNKVDGGPGMLGLKHSNESNEKNRQSQLGKKLSEETKKRISESRTGDKHWNYGNKYSDELKKKLSDAHKGYIMPEEQKYKIKQATLGKKRGSYTEEHKNSLREAKRSKMKPVYCVETGELFESISSASKITKVDKRSIQRSIQNNKTLKCKLTFKYKDNN